MRAGRAPMGSAKIFFKKYLTARPIHAIIITVIGGTMVNPKCRKEVNKNGNF